MIHANNPAHGPYMIRGSTQSDVTTRRDPRAASSADIVRRIRQRFPQLAASDETIAEVLAAAAAVLGSSAPSRARWRSGRPNNRAIERWDDEGGAPDKP